ncbi:MAG: hypothetical protein PVH89_09300 [Gammaproteobacteria bacterium]|jgi:hypothetical protein
MPRKLKRAINRQSAIRESRDLAWILFVVMLAVVYVAVNTVLQSIELAGTALTAGVIVGAVVGLVAGGVAWHVMCEALRLGRLMKDLDQIMRLEDSSSLVSGVRWSRLNPFSWWRD